MRRFILVSLMSFFSVSLIVAGLHKNQGATKLAFFSQSTVAAAATSAPAKTSAPSKTMPKHGGVLRMIMNQGPGNFGYPPMMDGNSRQTVGSHCLEPFLETDTTGQFTPNGLVTAYKMSPDGKSYTFTLRRGVTFHDGTDYNAQAAKWNMDKNREARIYGTTYWRSTDVVDDHTVRLNLSQPDYTVISNLGLSACCVISPTAYNKNGEQWAHFHPVGTGPFKLKSFDRDVSLAFEKFSDYWQKDRPYLDGVVFSFVKDQMVSAAALQKGEVDVFWRVEGNQAFDLQAKGFTVVSPINQFGIWLTPDSRNPESVLANKKVREALEYAANREAIAKAVGYGFMIGINQIADPSYPAGYIPGFKGREYNPARAKQLLTEAGYPNGFKTRVIAQTEMANKDAMVALQGQWKAVGVDLALDFVTRAKFVEDRTKGWRDGFILVQTGTDQMWTSTLDRIFSVDGKTYISTQRPPGWAELMASANQALDYKTYQERTQKCIRLLYDEATALPLWGESKPFVIAPYVKDGGFLTKGLAWWAADKTWLDK
jgi:peptide/nickel transport system substrate-binding protein